MTNEHSENIDPDTGEILGGPFEPNHTEDDVEAPPASFAHFLLGMHDGGVNDELSRELQGLVKEMRDASLYSGKRQKGSLTLKLDLEIDQELMFVIYDVKRKDPKPPRLRVTTFHTEEGKLEFDNPRQGTLPLQVARGQMKTV